MVDIGATTHAARAAGSHASLARSDDAVTVIVQPAGETSLSAYQRFCGNAVHAPAQHPIWIRAWSDAVNEDAFIAFVERDGRAVMALALEVVRQGPFRVARFMGGNHANGNFVATGKGSAPLDAADRKQLASAIRRARPDVDIVVLERQNPAQDGHPNPFARLATIQSPNVSLAVDLAGGFAETLSRVGGKRKRKKYRLQVNKFTDAGGYRLIEATTPGDVERLIADFFVMKAERFRKKGIHDVFAPREIREFFRQLYLHSLDEKEPSFVLHAVEVGGELKAVNGLSMLSHSVVCEFGGIRDDDSNASPGFFLDYSNIEQSCERGKKLYDFSVGDEDYKRSWCNVETWQFDVLLPLTAKGHIAFAYDVTRARIVRSIKSSEFLWSLVKRFRKRGAEVKPETDD